MGAEVYQQLAQRWVGPVGWVLALWARLLSFGSGIGSVLRLRPLRSPGRQAPAERRSPARENGGGSLAAAIGGFRLALLRRWPDAAESLVRGRFDPAVRAAETAEACVEAFSAPLTARWGQAVEAEISQIPAALGGFWLQTLLNAPAIGLIGYVGWVAVGSFFRGEYLGGAFFVHAFWLILIVLALGFFLLQVLIRLRLNPGRIAGRAAERLRRGLPSAAGGPGAEVGSQLQALREMMAASSNSSEDGMRS